MAYSDWNPKIDAVAVEHATDMAKMISEEGIKHALEFMADFNKEKRLKRMECKTCFYFRSVRIGGQAMTTVKCGVCDEEMGFSSTCVDKLCGKCSDKNELCVFCGGDIKMRPRRVYTRKI